MALLKQVGDHISAFVFPLDSIPRPLTVAAEKSESTLSVAVQADSTNASSARIGNSVDQVWELTPGQTLVLNVSRMSTIYARGGAGDRLNIIAVRTTGEVSHSPGA